MDETRRSLVIGTFLAVLITTYAWVMYWGRRMCIYIPPSSPSERSDLVIQKKCHVSGVDRFNEDGSSRQDILRSFCQPGDRLYISPYQKGIDPGHIELRLINGMVVGLLPSHLGKQVLPFLKFGGNMDIMVKEIYPVSPQRLLACEIEVQLFYQYRIA